MLLALLLLTTGCSTPTVWGYPPDEFRQRLREGTLELPADSELDDAVLAELSLLGDGAAYYLSFHPFVDATIPEKLLTLEIAEGNEPWAYAAALELADRLSRIEGYEKLLELDAELDGRYRSEYAWRRIVLDASYWARRDIEARELLLELRRDFPDETAADGELRLMEAVLEQRTGREGWTGAVLELFRDLPAGIYHIRAWDYLRLESLSADFSAPEIEFLGAVDSAARGERGAEGEAAFGILLRSAADPRFSGPGTLATLAGSARLTGNRHIALDALRRVPPDLEIRAAELRARMLREMHRHIEAGEIYARLAQETEGSEAERFRWYAFSSAVRADAEAAVDRLPRLLLTMREPEYYADVLNELAGLLTASGKWDPLVRAYRYLDGAVGSAVLDRYAYLSARAIEAGLTDEGTDLPAAEILRRLADGSYPGISRPAGDSAANGDGRAYYRLMASVLTGGKPQGLLPQGPAASQPAGDADLLAHGFLAYGLFERAAAAAAGSGVSDTAALATSRELLARGDAEQGVRLLLRRSLPAAPEEYYPRPFRAPLEAAAEEEGIPSWLLFALVREESLFNPRALSHAGARGLTQLMPSTAADVARRLKIDNPDSFDPEQNLRLGAWYLDHMIERTAGFGDALAAYNAGITRLRRWRGGAESLPDDLFIETLPFEETREYVKRLLVSSFHYGYLYYRLDAGEVAAAFFPRL